MDGWLFYVPSTARSFRDGTTIWETVQDMISSTFWETRISYVYFNNTKVYNFEEAVVTVKHDFRPMDKEQ